MLFSCYKNGPRMRDLCVNTKYIIIHSWTGIVTKSCYMVMNASVYYYLIKNVIRINNFEQ